MDTGLVILISAAVAMAGWLYTGRLQRNMDRRQHTYRIIIRQLDDEQFNISLSRIRTVLEKGTVPDPGDERSKDDIDKIDYLLNHYEFLSAALWAGDIDEGLMRACEYSRITKLFTKMNDYIVRSRDFRTQPTMYENLEAIARRWLANSVTPAERLYQFVMFKPCRKCPPWLSHMNNLCALATKAKSSHPKPN